MHARCRHHGQTLGMLADGMIALTRTLSALSTGDLIFVRPPLNPDTPLDNAILDVGNATIDWLRAHGVKVPSAETSTHVALAWRNESDGGALSFIEATPPAVRLTSAEQFVRRKNA